MNTEEIIEAVYEIEAVEGLAIFDSSQQLVENQLALSEEAVVKIGQVLFQMKGDLGAAERRLCGLLLQSPNISLFVYVYGEALLLLQTDSNQPTNPVYLSLKSKLSVPAVAEVATVEASTIPAVEEVVVDGIVWSEFRKGLLSAFKRVAPVQLAKKMVQESSLAAGVTDDSAILTRDVTRLIAHSACEKIPNPARRKMLGKELETLLARY